MTNVSDGVDKDEAVVLAQNFLIENGLDSQHDVYRVGKVVRQGDFWRVQFESGIARGVSQYRRFEFVEPIEIWVSAATGKVGIPQD